MPARKILILWHITIFAVHGFCSDIVFLYSYPTVGRANFLFFTFTQKVFVRTRHEIFIYFKARLWVTVKIGIKFRPRLFRLYLDRI